MKLAILVAFLFIAAVSALPVVEVKEGETKQLVKDESAVGVAAPPGQADAEEQQPGDDLKTDATFWGGWGGYRHYGYGGWGGYYNPYYTSHYYRSYPTYYRSYPTYYYSSYW